MPATIIFWLIKNLHIIKSLVPNFFPFIVKWSIKRSLKRCLNNRSLLLYKYVIISNWCCIPCFVIGLTHWLLPIIFILTIIELNNALNVTIYLICANVLISLLFILLLLITLQYFHPKFSAVFFVLIFWVSFTHVIIFKLAVSIAYTLICDLSIVT